MSTESSSYKKYWRPLLILVAVVLLLWLVYASMAVLIPFLVGILLAYLLMPVVLLLEKIMPPKGKGQKAKRVISIAIVFIVFTVICVLFMVYMGAALVSASTVLINKAPEYFTKGMEQATQWLNVFRGSIPQAIEAQIEGTLTNLGPSAGKFAQDFFVGSMAVIPATMPTVVGFFTLPFFLFFVLFDYESFKQYFHDMLPASSARHTEAILGIIGNVMGRYIRSQIILGLIVGGLVFLGLWILGVQYALAMGAVTAITQFIPVVGPVVSGLVIIILTLAIQPDKIIGAILVFVIAEGLLNVVFLNWVQGKYMQIHPAVVMVLLVVGGYIGGFWGMILALPVCATIWEIFKYFRAEHQAVKLQT
jgi:predicted PurR-regulated permease PerM